MAIHSRLLLRLREVLGADVDDQLSQYGGARLYLRHVDVLVWSVRGRRISRAVLHCRDSAQTHEES